VPAFGIGLTWFGYALTSWGYCMLRGYNVKFTDWINPLHPWAGTWPPPKTIPASEVFPSVTVGSTGGAAEASDPSGTAALQAAAGTGVHVSSSVAGSTGTTSHIVS
jgi:hypothetical protein